MIVGLLRKALLLEILFSCFTSNFSSLLMSNQYQTIKEVLRFAKMDSNFINQARIIAQDYVAKDNIHNMKDAMCCVGIFKLADDTTGALMVIENMESRNLNPDTFLYNNVISVCTRVSDWRLAIDILLLMQKRKVFSDTISFSSAINACAKAGRWRESLNLLNEMAAAGVKADTICYSSTISACAAAGCWKESLLLLSDMRAKKVPIDTIVCNSAISACGLSGEWTVALRLMEMMRNEGLVLNAYTYSAAMISCDTAGQCDEVLSLLKRMLSEMIPISIPFPTAVTNDMENLINIRTEDTSPKIDITSLPSTTSASTFTSTSTSTEGSETSSYKAQPPNFIKTATVPFNVAISATLKCGRIHKAKELFDQMKILDIPRNAVTYTTLITGITKSKNFNQRMVLDVYKDMMSDGVKRSGAIFGAVIAAAEKCDDWVLTLNLLEEMKEEKIATSSFVYHSAISACGKAGKYEMTLELLEEMKERKVERTTVTYSLLINACKKLGLFNEALKFLSLMEKDFNEGVVRSQERSGGGYKKQNDNNYDSYNYSNSDTVRDNGVGRENYEVASSENRIKSVSIDDKNEKGDSREKYMKINELKKKSKEILILSGLQPDTIVYSSLISVCVGSQQWGLALELLERMEKLDIPRNIVTYNTVIEALSNANETARAEIVYQSALRTGIYNHWHQNSKYYSKQKENDDKNDIKKKYIGNNNDNDNNNNDNDNDNNNDKNNINTGNYNDKNNINTDNYNVNENSFKNTKTNLPKDTFITSEVMDLHNFPVAVAKAAVMLVLTEMCTGQIPIPDPLILITGRGNHMSVNGQRGILKKELLNFFNDLGLKLLSSDDVEINKEYMKKNVIVEQREANYHHIVNSNSNVNNDNDINNYEDGNHIFSTYSSSKSTKLAGSYETKSPGVPNSSRNKSQSLRNPGRLWLTKESIEKWLDDQKLEDEIMRSRGTRGAHGNLFLKIAIAKQKLTQNDSIIPLNVRAVCPFSTATHGENVSPSPLSVSLAFSLENDLLSSSLTSPTISSSFPSSSSSSSSSSPTPTPTPTPSPLSSSSSSVAVVTSGVCPIKADAKVDTKIEIKEMKPIDNNKMKTATEIKTEIIDIIKQCPMHITPQTSSTSSDHSASPSTSTSTN